MQSTSTSISTFNNSSSPLIGGIPFAASIAESFVENLPQVMLETLMEIQQEEEEFLQMAMQDHPDWKEHAGRASVQIEGNQIVYGVRDNDQKTTDLEYGNPVSNIAPTGLMRATAQRRSYDVAVKMSEKFDTKTAEL